MSVTMTVSELSSQVRSQLDESNVEVITPAMIVQALNRAQRFATEITSRKYEDTLLAQTVLTTQAGSNALTVPLDAFGCRVAKLELLRLGSGGVPFEMKRISFRDVTNLTTSTLTSLPEYWCVQGRQMLLYPQPTSGLLVRVWYVKAPDNLVVSQGQITTLNVVSNYLTMDSVGADIQAAASSLASYVNICDQVTGLVKCTLQVAAVGPTVVGPVTVPTDGVLFKAVPTRATVLGKTVVGAVDATVAVDDFIGLVGGTAVCQLPEAYQDYLIQYAIVELKRKLGDSVQEEVKTLADLEEKLQHMWVAREQQHRVKKVSPQWSRFSIRRW